MGKKTFSTTLILVLVLTLLLTGCRGMDKERSEEIKTVTAALEEELTAAFTGTAIFDEGVPAEESPAEETEPVPLDVAGMLDVLVEYADTNQWYYYRAGDDALAMVKHAAGSDNDVPDLTLLCTLDAEHPEDSAAKAAVLLSVMSCSGSDRKVTCLFTASHSQDMYGVAALPDSFFDTDNIVSLTTSEANTLYTRTAGIKTYTFSKDTKAVKNEGRKTYRITISGLSGHAQSITEGASPDPVKPVYDILSYCEDAHMDYRIHRIKVTGPELGRPTDAVIVFSLKSSDVPKFQTKFEKISQTFTDKHLDAEPDLSITMEEVKNRDKALAPEDATVMLSMLYTIRSNESYLSEEDEQGDAGINDIVKISVTPEKSSLVVTSRTTGKKVSARVRDTYEALAELNGFDLERVTTLPTYTIDEPSLLWQTLSPCFDMVDLEMTEGTSATNMESNAVKARIGSGTSQVCLGISTDKLHKYVQGLILYIESPGGL